MKIFEHQYKGFGIHPSECRVYVEKIDDIYHICFEDIGIGTSITNASEQLASEMILRLNVMPDICKFYETYNHPEGRTFDEITYKWLGIMAKYPDWKPSKNQKIFGF
jgi:hypothetical protein